MYGIDFDDYSDLDIERGGNWDVFHATPHARKRERMFRRVVRSIPYVTAGLTGAAGALSSRFVSSTSSLFNRNVESMSTKRLRAAQSNSDATAGQMDCGTIAAVPPHISYVGNPDQVTHHRHFRLGRVRNFPFSRKLFRASLTKFKIAETILGDTMCTSSPLGTTAPASWCSYPVAGPISLTSTYAGVAGGFYTHDTNNCTFGRLSVTSPAYATNGVLRGMR